MRPVLFVLLTVALAASVSVAQAVEAVGPRALSTPAPVYDEAERQAGHAGKTHLRLEVAADGTVAAASIEQSSGWPVLDARAVEAAKRWRFEPARDAAGNAVAASVAVPVEFAAASPPAAGAGADDPVAQARSTSCAAFLSEVSAHRLANDPLGTGRFATVWGALLEEFKGKYGPAAAMAKVPTGKRVFENTVASCRRAPARTLGATVDSEFFRIR